MPEDFTKDAMKVLDALYKEYLAKRLNNQNDRDAMNLRGARHLQEMYFESETIERVNKWCCELERDGYLQNVYDGGLAIACVLTDKSTVYMESIRA